MNDQEKQAERLRETILDLERNLHSEQQARNEVEGLIEALGVLTDLGERSQVFSRLHETLKRVFRFDDSLVLTKENGASEFQLAFASSEVFANCVWKEDSLTKRIRSGQAIALFDVSMIPTWKAHSDSIQNKVKSAIYVLLRGAPKLTILIGTHHEKSFFGEREVSLATRFSPLASQALSNLDHANELNELNEQLKTEMAERTNAQQQLDQQKQQMVSTSKMVALGEMASGIAHEINNPVTVIKTLAFQLKLLVTKTPLDLEKIQTMLDKIDSTTGRIAKIIKGLRSFSRDTTEDQLQQVNVKSLIQDTVALCQERFINHGVLLEVEAVSAELIFEGNQVSISQVLLNLLNNAHDAVEGKKGAWVRLVTTDLGEAIRFTVTDSGSGIPASVREKIFQPFFTTKEIGKGTGIGLSISYGIVTSHSGSLKIDETNPNTCFVVEIPKWRKVSAEKKTSN